MQTNGRTVAIFPSRWKLSLLACGALALVGAIFWDLYTPPRHLDKSEPIWLALALWPVVTFCVLGAAWLLWRALWRRPFVIANDDGVLDHSGFVPSFISWNEVVDVRDWDGNLIAVLMYDEDEYVSRQRPLRRALIRLSTLFGYPPLLIAGGLLEIQTSEATSLLAKRFQDWKAVNGIADEPDEDEPMTRDELFEAVYGSRRRAYRGLLAIGAALLLVYVFLDHILPLWAGGYLVVYAFIPAFGFDTGALVLRVLRITAWVAGPVFLFSLVAAGSVWTKVLVWALGWALVLGFVEWNARAFRKIQDDFDKLAGGSGSNV